MLQRIAWTVVIVASLLAVSAARAAEPRFELSVMGGTTASDGVDGPAVTIVNVGTFDSIDHEDSGSWGIRAAYLIDSNLEAGVLFDQQPTTLQISGSKTVDLGDQSVSNVHVFAAYSFLEPEAKVRPYLLAGLGATVYGTLDVNVEGYEKSIDGESKFSPTFGAGAKMFLNPKLGLRLEGRVTPTYIKSDPVGVYGDPYWGYWVVEEAQYANQLELAAGVIVRF